MSKLINYLLNLFIPQEENNFRAKALHINFLTCYLIFVLFLTFTVKSFSYRFGDVLGFATDISVEKLYQLTNNIRQQNNLPLLIYSQELASAAKKKADDMFAKNYWSHYSPDGKSPWDFILSSGYKYEYAGENLAKNFLFSQGVIDAWMASSSHRENILNPNYSQVGFAVANGILNGEQTTLVVEMFAKPLTVPFTETLAKESKTLVLPTVTLPVKQPIQQMPILAQKSYQPKNNFLSISYNASLIFLTFFLLAIILDFYFAAKLRIIRIGGKNIAHLIFVGFIFIGLLIVNHGSIL